MHKVAIHQPQYIPWPAYFDKILNSDVFVFLDNVQFQKNGLQNRNQIKTPQGKAWLTLPVKHDFGQNINQASISQPAIKQKHLRSLQMNYAKAPYFNEIYALNEPVLEQENNLLSDVSITLIRNFLDYLGHEVRVVKSSNYDFSGKSSDLVLNICKHFEAEQYLSGGGAMDYMDKESFDDAGIEIMIQSFDMPEYNQCFPKQGFIPGLSLIDLLFNEGKGAVQLLQKATRPYVAWNGRT